MSTAPPPNRHAALSWIAKADEDIDAVDLCLATGHRLANIAAFDAQQAAEKLLKALIASTGSEPPRTHDLAELTYQAPENRTEGFPVSVWACFSSSWNQYQSSLKPLPRTKAPKSARSGTEYCRALSSDQP